MSSFTVYLAEPIDQATGTGIYAFSSQIEGKLVDLGLNVYRPASAWKCGGDPTAAIQQVNTEAIARADLMVAYLPKGTPTIGVPIEIAMAAGQRKSVVAVTPIRSYALAGIEGVTVVDDLDDLEAVVTAICRELEKQKHPKRLVDLSRPRAEMAPAIDRHHNRQPDWPPLGDFQLLPPPMAEPMPLVYQADRDGTQLKLAHDDDAGIDLYTRDEVTIEGGDYAKIATGIRIKLPEGVWGWIVARSSTFEKYRLLVLPGIMDTGYRGPYYAAVWNTQSTPVHIPAGTRLCQVILFPNTTSEYRPVRGLVPIDTTRGEGGFGSTGARLHRQWCGLDTDHAGNCQLGPRCCAGCANGTGCDKSEAPE